MRQGHIKIHAGINTTVRQSFPGSGFYRALNLEVGTGRDRDGAKGQGLANSEPGVLLESGGTGANPKLV